MRAKSLLVVTLLLVLGGCVVYPLPPDPALNANPNGDVINGINPGPPPPGYSAPPGAAVLVAPAPVYAWPYPGYWYPPPPRGPWPGPWWGPWGPHRR